MKWCEQCGEDVGYVERQVADDPHGLEYYELECEQCGSTLATVVVEVDPEVERLIAKFRADHPLDVRKAIAEAAREARMTLIPEGDERCGFTMDACQCMKRKGHDGLHSCTHGAWRAPSATEAEAEAVLHADYRNLLSGHEALRAIRDLPSRTDLLTNAVARAMYEIASRVLEDHDSASRATNSQERP